MFWIANIGSKCPTGYNSTDGGDGVVGKKISEEYKKLLSSRMTGEGNYFYGKKHTKETKKLIGEKGLGRPAWNKGKQMSDSTREKLSETIKRKWRNGEYDTENFRKSRQKLAMDRSNDIWTETDKQIILNNKDMKLNKLHKTYFFNRKINVLSLVRHKLNKENKHE